MSEIPEEIASDEWVDLGNDHSYQIVRLDGPAAGADDGKICGVWVRHTCAKHTEPDGSFIPVLGPNAWTMTSESPLTLEPSLLRTDCGDHGFIRDGKWVVA